MESCKCFTRVKTKTGTGEIVDACICKHPGELDYKLISMSLLEVCPRPAWCTIRQQSGDNTFARMLASNARKSKVADGTPRKQGVSKKEAGTDLRTNEGRAAAGLPPKGKGGLTW